MRSRIHPEGTVVADRQGGTEQRLREEILLVGRLLHQKGFVAASDGNISARWGEGQVLTTPSGLSKGFMTAEQLILTDMEGRLIPGGPADPTLAPTSELHLHLEAYRQRPDVQAVVHAHPPVATAFTIAGLSLEPCVIPEVVVTLGTVPTAPYATPGTPEGAAVIRELIRTHDALLLDHHGAVAVGQTPLDAYLKLEKVEHAAEIILIAKLLGRVIPLSPEQVATLLAIRERHGLLRPGDRETFQRVCGVWIGDA